jgi:hypothetical protein
MAFWFFFPVNIPQESAPLSATNIIISNPKNPTLKYMQNGTTTLNLTEFYQNFHPVWAKMMPNLFRRGISVI